MALNFINAILQREAARAPLFSINEDSFPRSASTSKVPSEATASGSDESQRGFYIGRLVRHGWVGLGREQPTPEQAVVQEVRSNLLYERKLNVILRNPEIFRRYQAFAVASRHFSPIGLGFMLLEFMNQDMKIPDILADIEREGEQSRYNAVVVNALDDYDTETITFESEDHEEEMSSYTVSAPYLSSRPSYTMTSSPTSVIATPDLSVASPPKAFSLLRRRQQIHVCKGSTSLERCDSSISLPSLDDTLGEDDDVSVDSIRGSLAFRPRQTLS